MRQYYLIILSIIFFSTLSMPLGYAEVVYHEQTSIQKPPPVEKNKKKANKRKRKFEKQAQKRLKRKKSPEQTNDIVPGLYTTFIVMMLLPLFVIIGFLLVGLGLPILNAVLLYIGLGLIVFGNAATILAGVLAGANKTYSTQILSFAMWLFFGLNIAGGITLLILLLINPI